MLSYQLGEVVNTDLFLDGNTTLEVSYRILFRLTSLQPVEKFLFLNVKLIS